MNIKLGAISELKKGSHIHMIGICGTAMASLAGLLKERGFKISGSDSNPYPPMSTQIESLGIQLYAGYSAQNLKVKPDFVIVGNVVSMNNPEAQELISLQIPATSLASALGDFIIGDLQSIVVSGTHGKTTTTSVATWVAQEAGLKPGYLIGGIPKNIGKSFQNSAGPYFVIEGDEYDTAYFDKVPKFVHYKPRHVIFTSCEFDHADIYENLDAVKAAFLKLMKLIPEDGTLVYWAENPNVAELAKQSRAKKRISYGLKAGDYQAQILENGQITKFKVKGLKKLDEKEFSTTLSGEYNILNLLSVIALYDQLGFDVNVVERAIRSFSGVKRRQEVLGEIDGRLVIEDFAHHPTAVRETLKGIRAQNPKRRIWAIFEPRSATSRRKIFQKEYAEAFDCADEVLIAEAFDQSKITEHDRFSSQDLVQDLIKRGRSSRVQKDSETIIKTLVQESKSGDLFLIMSNGGFGGIYGKLLSQLETLVSN